jgi:hypothetical protein
MGSLSWIIFWYRLECWCHGLFQDTNLSGRTEAQSTLVGVIYYLTQIWTKCVPNALLEFYRYVNLLKVYNRALISDCRKEEQREDNLSSRNCWRTSELLRLAFAHAASWPAGNLLGDGPPSLSYVNEIWGLRAAVYIAVAVFRAVAPRGLQSGYQGFEITCCLHRQCRGRQYVKQGLPTRLHVVEAEYHNMISRWQHRPHILGLAIQEQN